MTNALPRFKKTVRYMSAIAVIGLLGIWSQTAEATRPVQYERPSNRLVSDVLPPEMIQGPHYRVQDKVVSYGYMDHFSVSSDFGVFEVTGHCGLRKLLREINAIAVLRETKKGQAYLESVKKAGKAPLEFGENLITDPVDTISGVPKGVNRLFENIRLNRNTPANPHDDSRMQQLLSVSSKKREFASALGVDVYSSNTVLQKELNSLGWASALGSLSVSAAMAPFGGPAVLALQSSRMANQMNELLKVETPARLHQINADKLLAMGVPADLVERFLCHPAFTPRHNTIITGSLAALGDARGCDAFIRLVLFAEDEETANFYQNMAELLRTYHETVSPVREISVASIIVLAKAADGSVVIPFPLDHAIWTEHADRLIDGLMKGSSLQIKQGKPYVTLWVTGTLSPVAREHVTQRGIKVMENLDRRFAFMD